jgi:SAM-dependent methyltransferase
MALDALIGYVLAVMAMYVLFVAIDCQVVDLSDETLTGDLRLINTLYNIEGILETPPSEAVEYYEHTTDRDYALLERVMGPGMHTRIKNNNDEQFKYVAYEIDALNADRVLEIGCGKGHSRVLARMLPHVHFTGIDMVQRHIEVAESYGKALTNLKYAHADATQDISHLGKFQVIFGVESLCHMDSKEAREKFIKQAKSLLTPGGKIVIIDGFRSETFDDTTPDQQLAMMLAERGFSIARMPSTADWIQASEAKAAHFTDLTKDAIVYWKTGWRVARFLLHFPLVLYYYACSSRARTFTLMNILSVATTAHALRGSAEYGVLVMTT